MCKYEMDPTNIVEDTEQTRFCPQMDGQTDWRTDGQTNGLREISIPPFQLRLSGGYNKFKVRCKLYLEFSYNTINFQQNLKIDNP